MKDSEDTIQEVPNKLKEAIGRLKSDEIDLYRIFVEQTRQLHGDVWNGVRFFLTINTIIIGAMAAVYVRTSPKEVLWFELALSVAGILFTLIGMFILSKHREYYLDGLMRKTILEYGLGLYQEIISGVNLVLPWSVPKRFVEQELLLDPEAWKKKQKWRWGTITLTLRVAYIVFLLIYIVVFFTVIFFVICIDPKKSAVP